MKGQAAGRFGSQNTNGQAPNLPPQFVARPRLLERLDTVSTTGLAVLSAPAGAGKTLALADWAAQHTGVTWLSIELEDREPVHFWSRLLHALRSTGLIAVEPLLTRLQEDLSVDRWLVSGLSEIARGLGSPQLVVLDDLHLLRGSTAMASVADLVQRRQLPLQLAISARSILPFPHQRLRLENRLTEVGPADLSFRHAEAAQLLAYAGVQLGAEQLGQVMGKTEGWATGLRLAADMLSKAEVVADAVSDLAGDDRSIADYFVEEVLSQQPFQVRQFLLDTSVVHEISADLAETLTGRSDSTVMLSHLELENLFLVALDERRSWFRYQHLFLGFLRQRLARQGHGHRRNLHQRAADWYADHEQPLKAGQHLSAAGAWPQLSRHTVRTLAPLVLGSQRDLVAQLMEAVPATVVSVDPDAAAAAVIAAFARRDALGMRAHLERARAALAAELVEAGGTRDREVTEAALAAAEGIVDYLEGRVGAQLQSATAALRLLAPLTTEDLPALIVYRAVATTIVAEGYLWSGLLERTEETLDELAPLVAAATITSPVLGVQLDGIRSLLHLLRGELTRAENRARVAMEAAQRAGVATAPTVATAWVTLSAVQLARGDQAACALALDRARSCLHDEQHPVLVAAMALLQARLELLRGRAAAARSVLQGRQWSARLLQVPGLLQNMAADLEAELELAESRPRRAVELLTRASRRPVTSDQPGEGGRRVLLARAALLENRSRDALVLLAPLRTDAGAEPMAVVSVWLLSALAAYRLRLEAEARHYLHRALELAGSERVALPFLTAGPLTVGLLRHYLEVETRPSHWGTELIVRLDPNYQGAQPPPLITPLTNRERNVLALLPSMMNNAEIAQELYLSVNTVKVHLKSLYRKLEVDSRRQAVRRAQQLGLTEVDPVAGTAPQLRHESALHLHGGRSTLG